MSPAPRFTDPAVVAATVLAARGPTDEVQGRGGADESVIVEGWAQGFNVGALVFILLIVLCNYRRHNTLHKLILLELVLALPHGFFIFFDYPAYSWVLSSTAVPLYMSYSVHNVVAWIKIKPFLPPWGGRFFIVSLMLAQPYWVVESWANFSYFNNLGSNAFTVTRYIEPVLRDPWWVFTTVKLVLVINNNYEYTLLGLVRLSPRFGILILCMFASIVFIVVDIISTALLSVQSGINPYWRLALVFKCASDAIFLDDFKSVLDHIASQALRDIVNPGSRSGDTRGTGSSSGSALGRFNPLSKRRMSSIGRFSAGNHPHAGRSSFQGDGNGKAGMMEPSRTYSRDRWAASRSSAHCRAEGRWSHEGGGAALDWPGQILAETTITISEHEEVEPSQYAGGGRSGSEDHILSGESTGAARSGSSRTEGDVESGIPMMPMQRNRST